MSITFEQFHHAAEGLKAQGVDTVEAALKAVGVEDPESFSRAIVEKAVSESEGDIIGAAQYTKGVLDGFCGGVVVGFNAQQPAVAESTEQVSE